MNKIITLFSLCILWSTYAYAQPANDLCTGAIPATFVGGSLCVTASTLPFSTDGTTDSGLDNVCQTASVGLDQFFTWTATSTSLYWNSYTPGNPGVTIYSNSGTVAAPACGTEIICSSTFTQALLTGWAIGDNLIIQIYDFGTSVSDVGFCLDEGCTVPLNDDCAGAIPITQSIDNSCNNALTGQTNECASTSVENFCGGGGEVWYTFTSDASGSPLTIETSNLSTSGPSLPTATVVTVYSGGCGGFVAFDACDFSPLSFTPTPSTTYHFTVELRDVNNLQVTGDFDVCFYPDPCAVTGPPANDTCASATPIAISSDISCANALTNQTTTCATLDGSNNCGGGEEVWYTFTGGLQQLAIETSNLTGPNGAVNAVITLYDGSGGCLVGWPFIDCQFNKIVFSPTVGTTYFLSVELRNVGNITVEGGFDVCVYECPPPLNDACASATTMIISPDNTCANGLTNQTSLCSSLAPENNCGGGSEVWYTFTGGAEPLRILVNNITGPDLPENAVVTLYDGTGGCTVGWTFLSCQFNDILFTPTPGTVYFFSVEFRDAGNFSVEGFFDVCVYECPAPANDACASATPIVVSPDFSCANGLTGESNECSTPAAENNCGGSPEVWYAFTGGANVTNIDVSNIAGIDLPTTSLVTLYDATSGCTVGWSFISCQFNSISFTPTPGTSYVFSVELRDAANFGVYGSFDVCVWEDACPPDFEGANQLSGPINTMVDYETNGIISSDQVIGPAAQIDYDSRTEINLLPNFEIQLGAVFDAFIDGCNGGSGGNQ